jgi:plasmid stabilization system protein ParE
MKVVMTQTASESLWPIYLYHADYSQEYADAFQYEIDQFIAANLSSNPLLGHVYHEPRGIRRLIFQKRYNIYYMLRDETVFVLFIFDGRMRINSEIGDRGLDTDGLLK